MVVSTVRDSLFSYFEAHELRDFFGFSSHLLASKVIYTRADAVDFSPNVIVWYTDRLEQFLMGLLPCALYNFGRQKSLYFIFQFKLINFTFFLFIHFSNVLLLQEWTCLLEKIFFPANMQLEIARTEKKNYSKLIIFVLLKFKCFRWTGIHAENIVGHLLAFANAACEIIFVCWTLRFPIYQENYTAWLRRTTRSQSKPKSCFHFRRLRVCVLRSLS